MANSSKQTNSEELEDDGDFEEALIQSYASTINRMKDVADIMKKRNHVLYGNNKPSPTDSSVDEILNRIAQDVDLLESASVLPNSKENIDKSSKISNLANVESQQRCNTQLDVDFVCKSSLDDSFSQKIVQNEHQLFDGDSQDMELCNLVIEYENNSNSCDKMMEVKSKEIVKCEETVTNLSNINVDVNNYLLECNDLTNKTHNVIKINTDNMETEFSISATDKTSVNSYDFKKTLKSASNLLIDNDQLEVDDSPSSPILSTQYKKSFFGTPDCTLSNAKLKTENILGEQLHFKGFMTASNKEIKVSEQALKKVKNLFDDCSKSEFTDDIDTDFSESITLDDKFRQISDDSKSCSKLQENFGGFMTASNKVVKISDEALKHAKKIFNDISESESVHQQQKNHLFATSSTTDYNCDKLYAGALGENENFDESFSKNLNTFGGFMTASNKKITISEQALKKVQNLFDDYSDIKNKPDSLSGNLVDTFPVKYSLIPENESIDEIKNQNHSNDNTPFMGFMTANNKKIEISEKALNKVKNLFDDCINRESTDLQQIKNVAELNSNYAKLPKFQGFMTASNKEIAVSKESLRKVKNLFDDCLENKFIGQSTEDSKDFSNISSTVKDVEISNTLLVRKPIENDNTSQSNSKNHLFKGFMTASNKEIKISEQALSKVKNLFDDCLDSKLTEINDDRKLSPIITTNKNLPKSSLVESSPINIDKNNSKNHQIFVGFMTANNKEIKVSEAALQKVRNMFDDCSESILINEQNRSFKRCRASPEYSTADRKIAKNFLSSVDKPQNVYKKVDRDSNQIETNNYIGFKSANNKVIKISDEVLKKAQQLFNEIDCDTSDSCHSKTAIKSPPKSQSPTNSKSEYTDVSVLTPVDIIEPPSSPILQFKGPKTKRKLFKVPYKDNHCEKQETSDCKRRKIDITESNNRVINNSEIEIKNNLSLGNLSLQKSNRGQNAISLKSLYLNNNQLEDTKDNLPKTPKDCLSFRFENDRCDINGKTILTIPEIDILFKNHLDINSKLIPNGWIVNHLKWIICKLALYERMFSKNFSNPCILKATSVIEQLKYRYDKELYNAKRPILRKILEKDEVPCKRMVLRVSNIISVEMPGVIDENSVIQRLGQPQYEIELTDGWYSVMTILDPILCQAIDSGKINIGTKLIISGAELLNCEQGVAPLEDMGSVRLKISANSCRRCMPWLKLGLCKLAGPMTLKLEDCKPGGGTIPNIRMVPITIYPMMYMSKTTNGSIVMRSEKMQQIFNNKSENELQAKIEQLYADIEKEYSRENSKRKKSISLISVNKLTDASPDELADMMEITVDPQEFLNSLSNSQREAVERISVERQANIRYEIDSRVKAIMKEKGLEKEKPVRVLKARILTQSKHNDFTSAILTVWRPDDSLVEEIKEGVYFNATNLSLTGYKKGDLQVSAGKKSRFIPIVNEKVFKSLPNLSKFQKCCISFEKMYEDNFSPPFNEVDVVGLIIKIEPKMFDAANNQHKMQTVYLANEFKRIIAIVFWNGVKNNGFEKVIEEGKCLACQNLQNRSRSLTKRIRQLHVTELSNFTTSSKRKYLENALNNLKKALKINLKSFLNECVQELSAILSGAITPKKILGALENSKINTSRLQITNNGNYTKEEYDELSLTGLDFETTFVDTTANDTLDIDIENKVSNFAPSKLNSSSILASNNTTMFESPSRVEMRINRLKMYGEPPRLSPIVMRNSRQLNQSFNNPMANSSIEIKIDTSKNVIDSEEDIFYSPPLSLE